MSHNVLLYTPNLSADLELIGGVETCTLATVKQLQKGEFNPFVLTHGAGQFVAELEAAAIPFELISVSKELSGLSRNRILANPLNLFRGISTLPSLINRVTKIIAQNQIELVHCNHPYAFIIGGLAAKRVGIPCIWHFHEIWESGWLKNFYLWAARYFADRIVTIAEYESQTFPQDARLPPIDIIYNGFDFLEFRQRQTRDRIDVRQEFAVTPRTILLGYVSHLAPYKGQTTFIRALAKVKQKYPQIKALLVGGTRKSCETYPAELKELVAELNLKENIIFTGARSDIADIMAAIDIFASVSENEEFNRVMVEAMCFATPTIISDLRGGSIVVEDRVTGLLVPSRNPDRLAEAILQLIENPQLSQQLGTRGQKYVEQTFSMAKIARDYERLYRKAIAQTQLNSK